MAEAAGAPLDPSTLSDVLGDLERQGYAGQFSSLPDREVRCHGCRGTFRAEDAHAERLRRLEGLSNPDDMLAVVGLTCPRCRRAGTLVLNFGPQATVEDAEVLVAFDPGQSGGGAPG